MYFLYKGAGGQVFQTCPGIPDDLAGIIKIILGGLQNRAGDVPVIGADSEDDVHIFENGEPSFHCLVRALEVMGQGAVGDWAAHSFA